MRCPALHCISLALALSLASGSTDSAHAHGPSDRAVLWSELDADLEQQQYAIERKLDALIAQLDEDDALMDDAQSARVLLEDQAEFLTGKLMGLRLMRIKLRHEIPLQRVFSERAATLMPPQTPRTWMEFEDDRIQVTWLHYLLRAYQTYDLFPTPKKKRARWQMRKERLMHTAYWRGLTEVMHVPFSDDIQHQIATLDQILKDVKITIPRTPNCARFLH